MTIEIKSNHYVIKTDHFYAPEPIDGTVYIEVNNSRINRLRSRAWFCRCSHSWIRRP